MLDLGFSGFFTCLGLGCAELKLKALGLQIFMAWKKGGGEGGLVRLGFRTGKGRETLM